MSTFEEIGIQRDSKGELRDVICEIETPDLVFLNISGADIGLSTEHVNRGFMISLSRVKIYRRAPGTQIKVTRTLWGDIRSAHLAIDPADLQFVDAGIESLEKTTTRVGGELIIRFTAKKGSDGVGS